jgi:hypothetical protein
MLFLPSPFRAKPTLQPSQSDCRMRRLIRMFVVPAEAGTSGRDDGLDKGQAVDRASVEAKA